MDIIFKHAWVVFILFTFINAARIRSRSKQYIDKDPGLKDGYDTLIRCYLFFGNLPWSFLAIGDLSGSTKSIFDFFTPWKSNPVVQLFHASIIFLWILGSYWIYFRNGAVFLVKHPGLFNFSSFGVSDNIIKNIIKIFWGLGVTAGVIVETQLWTSGNIFGFGQVTTNRHPVYDFANTTPDYQLLLEPLLFLCIGIGIYFFGKKIIDHRSKTTIWTNKRKQVMIFGILFSSFAGLFLLLTIIPALGNYFKTSKIYKNKQYHTIEGVVSNFHPMPYNGHDTERFEVNGVPFEYSDYVVGDYGYHNTVSHGGVIREGLKVKISYFYDGNKNVILILDNQ